MTFTIFTNNILKSIYHNIKHIYNISNINLYERFYFMFLSIVSVISYNSGVNKNINFRVVKDKKYTVYNMNESKNNNIVVIPTLVRSLSDKLKLLKAINSIFKNKDVTIIIVDDGSTLNIMDLSLIDNVVLVKHFENYGPGAARNTGIEVSLKYFNPIFISFIDTDCQVDSNWLNVHSESQLKNPGIYCGQTVGLMNDKISRYHDMMGTLNGRSIDKGLLYGPSCNMSISRSILESFRFDERFPNASFEDVEFCVRLIKNDIIPQYLSGAVIFHDYDNTLMGFYNQFHRYGKSHPLMLNIHPEYHDWYGFSEEIPVS